MSRTRYLSSLRVREILLLQGSPVMGAALALGRDLPAHAAPFALLMAANVCLMAHVFLLNDWSNLGADLRDPTKAAGVFTEKGVAPGDMLAIAAGALTASLMLFGYLGRTTLAIGLGIAVLSALYSLPPFNWKGRPLMSSAAHLAGGVLHFLLGYSLGRVIDGRGVLIGTFVAVTFAAGHLTQELRDYDGDARSGIRTNAVAFGKRRTFAASLALFTISQALLFVLSVAGTIPRVLAVLVVLYPLHLRWSLEALADGLTRASVRRLQTRYRLLYASIGVALAVAAYAR